MTGECWKIMGKGMTELGLQADSPTFVLLTCGAARVIMQPGHSGGTCAPMCECPVERVTSTAAGIGDRMAVQGDHVPAKGLRDPGRWPV